MQNAKCEMQNAKFKMQNAKCEMQNAELDFRIKGCQGYETLTTPNNLLPPCALTRVGVRKTQKRQTARVCLFVYPVKAYLPNPIWSIKALVCGL